MEAKPSREKRRISARPSHGLNSRFRRSTFCALVSLTGVVIPSFPHADLRQIVPRKAHFPQKKNPPPDALWRWVISADRAMKRLSQQPPCARTHACTTTTCTHTSLAKIAEIRHAIQHSKLTP